MRAILVLTALPLLAVLLPISTAYADQFSFNPSTGDTYKQVDLALPAVVIGIASLVGVLLIANERKKAKGIWFSNNERLK